MDYAFQKVIDAMDFQTASTTQMKMAAVSFKWFSPSF